MDKLTPAQQSLLAAIERLRKSLRMSPTVQEIADELGIRAPSVHEALSRLEAKGYIRRQPNKARSIEVVRRSLPRKTHLVSVPIIGKVAAGPAILAIENRIGLLMVPESDVRGSCFALKIQGDSMIEADIFENDYVVVRQQPLAENNDIVVAMIDGEATVKRLHIAEDRVELRPANRRMKPIRVDPHSDFRIVGKVLHVCSQEDASVDQPDL